MVRVGEVSELHDQGTALLFGFFSGFLFVFFFFLDGIFLFQAANKAMWNPLKEDWCGWLAMDLPFPELKKQIGNFLWVSTVFQNPRDYHFCWSVAGHLSSNPYLAFWLAQERFCSSADLPRLLFPHSA